MTTPTPEELFTKYASDGWSGDAAAVGPNEFAAAIREVEVAARGNTLEESAVVLRQLYDEITEGGISAESVRVAFDRAARIIRERVAKVRGA